MPTLYKKTDRKPISKGAEILTRKGVRHALDGQAGPYSDGTVGR